jgi:hypothetical protein
VKVLVGGASGFVGRRLCATLAETGHDVAAMTRHPGSYDGAGTPIHGDVHDRTSRASRPSTENHRRRDSDLLGEHDPQVQPLPTGRDQYERGDVGPQDRPGSPEPRCRCK